MDKKQLKKQSQMFFKLISLQEGEKEIIFDSKEYVGFSLKKEYPDNVYFCKIKKKSGEDETRCLIRVGYRIGTVNKNKEADLFIDAGIWHNIPEDLEFFMSGYMKEFNIDPSSVENFNSSRLPFKIHTSITKKYIYNIEDQKFYTKQKKKEKSLREIIDDIFKTHLKSTNWFTFYRVKYLIGFAKLVLLFGNTIFYKFILREIYQVVFKDEEDIALIKLFLGKRHHHNDFKERSDSEDFHDTNQINKISEIKNKTEMDLPFFGGKFKVNYIGLISSIIILAILGLFFKDSYVISIFQQYNDNEVIQVSIVLLWILLFHLLFQYILSYRFFIHILNGFIRIYRWINNCISINGYDIEVYESSFKEHINKS